MSRFVAPTVASVHGKRNKQGEVHLLANKLGAFVFLWVNKLFEKYSKWHEASRFLKELLEGARTDAHRRVKAVPCIGKAQLKKRNSL